jgi:predicted DNA-binding ribbon-helix-helix protein
MQVIQINLVNSQTFQTLITRFLDVLLVPPDGNLSSTMSVKCMAKLRSKENLISPPRFLEPFPNQF